MTTTKSPEACFSPYTYAVPNPSFPGRVRSTCRQPHELVPTQECVCPRWQYQLAISPSKTVQSHTIMARREALRAFCISESLTILSEP